MLKTLLKELMAFVAKVTGISFSTSTGDMILFSILGLIALSILFAIWMGIAQSSGFVFSTVFILSGLYCFYLCIHTLLEISLKIHPAFVGILVILSIPASLIIANILATSARSLLQKIKVLNLENTAKEENSKDQRSNIVDIFLL